MSKTWAEKFDEAENGQQFGEVLSGMFGYLEKKMEEENESD